VSVHLNIQEQELVHIRAWCGFGSDGIAGLTGHKNPRRDSRNQKKDLPEPQPSGCADTSISALQEH
jgi:hypothetical protein